MTFPPLTVPRVFGGRYAVERPLGSGATATVYLCRDRQTMNPVAVKVLHLDLTESMGAERFLREIRLTSGLDHPSILPVIDSGAEGSQLYCVLPYMEGGTLRDLLREKKQLPIGEAVEIAKTIAVALAYAHDKGLIHRDIKPENILFHQGKAYLGDFGIARALYATAGQLTTTTTGVIRGTPAYMSPEQASGERTYDGRSDIYSLGCVVYEMISGMPPFVGPTTQSVMAQRFSTAPREMRAYRSSVSAAMERVVQKSMMAAPADRYSSAREFGDALEVAAKAPARPVTDTRRVVVGVFAAAVLILAGTFAGRAGFKRAAEVQADTTQLAVLPFEKDGDTQALGSIDALMYNAFSAWQGITVLEPYRVRDAVLKEQSASGVTDHRAVAFSLGAGRFVRGVVSIVPGGRGWLIQAWLYQTNVDAALKAASIQISPADLSRIDGMYSLLARQLLLRGSGGDTSELSTPSTTVLPALQSFGKGIDALDEWDFERADSMFQDALDADPRYSRAAFWLAQVRMWNSRVLWQRWVPLADRAVADSQRLPLRERELAYALAALGARRFEEACARYRELTEKNQSDFAAWFGLGRCQDADARVVSLAGAPGQWRYVASYQGAMRAYQRAFEVLSLSHRSMQRGAFQPLRDLLSLTPSKLRPATPPQPDSTQLFGRLDLDADTLVVRPIPGSLIRAADVAAVPEHLRDAITVQRQLFRSIAMKWSTSLPRSAGAKEAVAVSLEMTGDRAALDTVRVARALATDDLTRLRLATAEILLRVKFLEPGDVTAARGLVRSADSIVAANPKARDAAGAFVAIAAVLRGNCAATEQFLASSPVSQNPGIPKEVVGAVDGLTTRMAMGCIVSPAEIERLGRRISTSTGFRPDWLGVMTPLMRFALDRGVAPSAGTADDTPDYLVRAQRALTRGARDTVEQTLARLDRSRARTGYDDVRPDAIYLESKLALKLGDTTAAITALDRLLAGKSRLTPGMLNYPQSLAALLTAMKLRGDLAAARGDASAARWRDVALVFLPHQ